MQVEYLYPIVTVGGLIFAPDGEILLVRSHKWNAMYTLPGGKVELGKHASKLSFGKFVKKQV